MYDPTDTTRPGASRRRTASAGRRRRPTQTPSESGTGVRVLAGLVLHLGLLAAGALATVAPAAIVAAGAVALAVRTALRNDGGRPPRDRTAATDREDSDRRTSRGREFARRALARARERLPPTALTG